VDRIAKEETQRRERRFADMSDWVFLVGTSLLALGIMTLSAVAILGVPPN
jgi:hypothetical protein